MATTSRDTCQLELKRQFDASPASVFSAWTTAEALARWFGPTDDYTVIVHQLDVREGGTFRVELLHLRGASHVAYGVYRSVVPNEFLSFTWRWEDQPGLPETIVTVEIVDLRPGTELRLRHEGFPSEHDRAQHLAGWSGCTARLQREFATT
ncbi:MAG: SRPBCC domain-containing protein [Gemmatimonadaceae bacterium]